jgi:hypothetical protein
MDRDTLWGHTHRERLARSMDAFQQFPDNIRTALAETCRSEIPIRTVNKFRELTGLVSSTLYKQWNAAFDAGMAAALGDGPGRLDEPRP